MIGCAMASSTSLGMGVGPGAINWYFFIDSSLGIWTAACAANPCHARTIRYSLGCRVESRRRRRRGHRPAQSRDENGLASGAERGEELDHGAIVEGETRGAEALGIGREV